MLRSFLQRIGWGYVACGDIESTVDQAIVREACLNRLIDVKHVDMFVERPRVDGGAIAIKIGITRTALA